MSALVRVMQAFMDVISVAYDRRMLYTRCMSKSNKERRIENRAVATAYVNEVNAKTYCAICGKQPVEWHHEEHPSKPNDRVSSLRTQGASIKRIQKEIDRCTPLCRVHHMEIDGRLAALKSNQPYKKGMVYVGKLPCSCCGLEVKPLRNSMCVTCDNHHSGRRLRKTNSCDGCCIGVQC